VTDRSEAWIAVLALVAAGLVLVAPVLGRTGHAGAADVAMAIGATCGLVSFLIAAAATVRDVRAKARSGRAAEDAQ
jgi:uncharacterized membrane protein YhaH (DUF805 family)